MQVVGWIDAAQVQVILHAFPQGGEGFSIHFGHQEERRTGIEGIPVDGHAPATPAGFFAFLHHGHLAAVACQAGGGGDPADAGTHDQDLWLARLNQHGLSLWKNCIFVYIRRIGWLGSDKMFIQKYPHGFLQPGKPPSTHFAI